MQEIALPRRLTSESSNFSAGKPVTIDKKYLEAALAMLQPMNRRWWLVFQGNVSTNAGSGPAPDFKGGMLTHIFQNVMIEDGSGQKRNISGGELRAIAQLELGSGYEDPDDIAPSQSDLDVEFRVPLLFTLADRAGDPDDSAMLLSDFYSAGKIVVQFRSGTIGGGDINAPELTVNSGVVFLEADIEDYGALVSPARLMWESTALVANRAAYAINGKLRCAFLYVGDENEEQGSAWDSDGETLESTSLNLVGMAQNHFITAYLQEGYHDRDTDMVANGYVLPLFFPKRGQKITSMPVFDNLNVKFSQAVPSGGTIITGVWTQRSGRTIAQAFRGMGGIAKKLRDQGVVPGLRGDKPLSAFPQNQRRYLPVKLTSAPDGSPATPPGQSTR